jgi:hypothetical protein
VDIVTSKTVFILPALKGNAIALLGQIYRFVAIFQFLRSSAEMVGGGWTAEPVRNGS